MTITEQIKRKTGVHPRTKCFLCRKTAKEAFYGPPVITGINHPEYYQTRSFYGWGGYESGNHVCANCHRENELKSLFALMDARDAKKKLTKDK